MQRFRPGMECCKSGRVSVGLCCESRDQLACAVLALAYQLEHAPEDAGRLLVDLIATFPERLATFLAEAERAGQVPLFLDRAARACAARPSKSDRHAFRDQIAQRLGAADLAAFDARMSAEWRRLRGK